MTLDDFLSYAINKTFCFPEGKYCGECLSLVKQRIKLVEGFDPPASGVGSAYGYWTNFPSPLPQYFKKTQTPKRGDIVVWGTGVGEYGHIAIFLEKSGSGFYSLDQNWGGKHTHKQYHNFNNILGYLTPKGGIMENFELQELIKIDGGSEVFAFGKWKGEDTPKVIKYKTCKPSLLWADLQKSREAQKTLIAKHTKEIASKNQEIETLKEQLENNSLIEAMNTIKDFFKK